MSSLHQGLEMFATLQDPLPSYEIVGSIETPPYTAPFQSSKGLQIVKHPIRGWLVSPAIRPEKKKNFDTPLNG